MFYLFHTMFSLFIYSLKKSFPRILPCSDCDCKMSQNIFTKYDFIRNFFANTIYLITIHPKTCEFLSIRFVSFILRAQELLYLLNRLISINIRGCALIVMNACEDVADDFSHIFNSSVAHQNALCLLHCVAIRNKNTPIPKSS